MLNFYSVSFAQLSSSTTNHTGITIFRTATTLWTGKQRAIVLDFLCHSSYTNTARAFSRECTVRDVNVDADGDEVMNGDRREELVSGEDAELIISEDTLKQDRKSVV